MSHSLQQVQIHPTNKCNLNCIFCGIRRFPLLKELTDKKWLEILREIVEMKPREITISGGGEPLIRLDLIKKMIYEIKKYEVSCNLITNGTIFDDILIKKMILNQLDEVRISLHSSHYSLDRYLRGDVKAFFKTISFIEKLSEYKSKYKSNKPLICLWYVITSFNYDNIESFVNFAFKMNVDAINFRIINADSDTNLLPTQQQLDKVYNEILTLKKKFSTYIEIDCMFPLKELSKVASDARKREITENCILPFYEMVIFADGRVAPCCNFIDVFDENIVGSVMKSNIREIWEGAIFKKFREGKMKNTLKCKKCSIDMRFLNKNYKWR